ncbi:MAG: DUF1016 domain-containing protein [Clostridiales bacterium]|nr:DUF1016 domain-containing protein [Clostridiales bacterium]
MNDLRRTFDEVVSIIETARSNAFRKVNEELILMYMNVGRFYSSIGFCAALLRSN